MAGKKPESARQEAVRLISEMSDKQIMITFEAFNIQLEDETKTHQQGKKGHLRYNARTFR